MVGPSGCPRSRGEGESSDSIKVSLAVILETPRTSGPQGPGNLQVKWLNSHIVKDWRTAQSNGLTSDESEGSERGKGREENLGAPISH